MRWNTFRVVLLGMCCLLIFSCMGCQKRYVGDKISWGGQAALDRAGGNSRYHRSLGIYFVDLKFVENAPNRVTVTGTARPKNLTISRYGKKQFHLVFLKNTYVVESILLKASTGRKGLVHLSKEFDLPEGLRLYSLKYEVEYYP